MITANYSGVWTFRVFTVWKSSKQLTVNGLVYFTSMLVGVFYHFATRLVLLNYENILWNQMSLFDRSLSPISSSYQENILSKSVSVMFQIILRQHPRILISLEPKWWSCHTYPVFSVTVLPSNDCSASVEIISVYIQWTSNFWESNSYSIIPICCAAQSPNYWSASKPSMPDHRNKKSLWFPFYLAN